MLDQFFGRCGLTILFEGPLLAELADTIAGNVGDMGDVIVDPESLVATVIVTNDGGGSLGGGSCGFGVPQAQEATKRHRQRL